MAYLYQFYKKINFFSLIFLQLQYLYAFQKSKDPLDELLVSYKNNREHSKVKRSHRHARDCQPILHGNTTFETYSSKDSEAKASHVSIQRFVKRLPSQYYGSNLVYGHVATVENPIKSLAVLEPLEKGGCQKKTRSTVVTSSKQMNCRVSVNAGFFNTHTGSCLGNIVSSGKLVRDARGIQNANFGILENGELVTGYLSEENVSSGNGETDFYQLVTGVLWILRNGSLYINESIHAECSDTEETGTLKKFAELPSARTAVGHDKDGRVLIVQIDGKTSERGVNIYQFASILQSFGLVNAINLDGGGSATFVINNTVVNYPSDECHDYLCARAVSTILCVHDDICDARDCNGHGKCSHGQCVCDKPWRGPSCSQQECNGLLCSVHEVCINDSCICQHAWTGEEDNEVLSKKTICSSNFLNSSARNETTKTLIKRFLIKNYAWMDALLAVSLIINLILLIVLFCGSSSSHSLMRRSRFNRKDDQMHLLTGSNDDDEEM